MAVVTLAVVADKTGYAVWGILLIAAHEIGHLAAGILMNYEFKEINFGLASIDICEASEYRPKSYVSEILIVVSGCAVNFVISLILWIMYILTRNTRCIYIALQSLAIGMINIMPVHSLDGGKLAVLISHRYLDYKIAAKVCNILSLIFLIPLIFLGIILLAKSRYNFSVILLVIYLVFEKYF